VFISLVTWNNLLKRLNPTEKPLYCTALLVEFWIKPEWSPSFWMSPSSPVDQEVALDSSFPIVLTNLPRIVGCIRRDDRGRILNLRNLKCFERWLVEQGIMGIGGCNCASKRETGPIHQSTQLVPLYLFIAIIAGRSPFSPGYPWYPSHSVRDRSFGSYIQIGEGRGRSPGTPPSRIIQGGTGEPSIWCRSLPEHRARCSRYSGRTGYPVLR